MDNYAILVSGSQATFKQDSRQPNPFVRPISLLDCLSYKTSNWMRWRVRREREGGYLSFCFLFSHREAEIWPADLFLFCFVSLLSYHNNSLASPPLGRGETGITKTFRHGYPSGRSLFTRDVEPKDVLQGCSISRSSLWQRLIFVVFSFFAGYQIKHIYAISMPTHRVVNNLLELIYRCKKKTTNNRPRFFMRFKKKTKK